MKAKRDLDVLPPTHGALVTYQRENYQANVWLQADYVIMGLENKVTETIGMQEDTCGLEVVWKHLLSLPDA